MMSVGAHKVSGNLLICLGTESIKSPDISEVVIFEIDQKNDCKIIESSSYRFYWPHK